MLVSKVVLAVKERRRSDACGLCAAEDRSGRRCIVAQVHGLAVERYDCGGRAGTACGCRAHAGLRTAAVVRVEQHGGRVAFGQLILVEIVLVARRTTLAGGAPLRATGKRLLMAHAHLGDCGGDIEADDHKACDGDADDHDKADNLAKKGQKHPGEAVADIAAPCAEIFNAEQDVRVCGAACGGDAEASHHGKGHKQQAHNDPACNKAGTLGENGDRPCDKRKGHKDCPDAEERMQKSAEALGEHAGCGGKHRDEQSRADDGHHDARDLLARLIVEQRCARLRRHGWARCGLHAALSRLVRGGSLPGASLGGRLLRGRLLGAPSGLFFGCLLRAGLALRTTHALEPALHFHDERNNDRAAVPGLPKVARNGVAHDLVHSLAALK